ncbi:Tetraspanin-8, putative [Perkinsus marinus ATCC 50983]|uniref:Tetraspanin-8, putative n=1 Tax=Perkinsus marinus (strain ATCC 50983 / TXsc) TaxID=423536 RepID=C5LEX8_PERM5|nr:Tetraspanin-8, putative [Perkinsus marinus ATCC 50983]EER04744.1 Tetraspanin-8, putative [Perkinsus marinus ATCC 50983]|eukprot:XP_002772928.1 Tetraspanin-8, putative [Perkinsus marinus ATCC 50983]
MTGCCTATSKLINYFVNTIVFLLGALVTALAIYILVSDFKSLFTQWRIWVGVATGIVLIIVALLGCGATKNQDRCVLTAFLFLAGVVFALLCVIAIASSVYLSNLVSIGSLNSPALNNLSGRDLSTYRFIRDSYTLVYDDAECRGGVCGFTQGSSSLQCSPIFCKSRDVTKTLNKWLNTDRSSGITPASFQACLAESAEDSKTPMRSSASAWCGSNTSVINTLNRWSVGILIGLWVVTAFIMFVCIANCVLICGKDRKGHGAVTVDGNPQRLAYAQPVYGGDVQIVKV